jgi:two-component system LytT family response regulator
MDSKPTLNAIIIDYDTAASNHLKDLLKDFGFIEVLGYAYSYESAKELIADNYNKTDLVFIDLNMHDADGMDLLSNINPQTKICFIENNADLALKAFDYNVVDYIIKPVSIDRLYKTLKKFKTRKEEQSAEHKVNSHPRLAMDNLVLINVDHELKLIKVNSLVYIEAKGNYTSVHMDDGTTFTAYGLIRIWDDKLPIHDFFRIHRSTIINLHHVVKIERGSNDTGIIFLKGINKPLEVSRSHFSHFKHTFRLIGPH